MANKSRELSGMDDTGADRGWDTYKERVLRNEGSLDGLKQLVSETRAADRLLIEQRASSLEKLVETVRLADARLIEQRSDSLDVALREAREDLRRLMDEQRQADRDEYRSELAASKELTASLRKETVKRFNVRISMIEKVFETAIGKNFEQSNAQIGSLDDRAKSRWAAMEQQVSQWREGDREARELQAAEYARRLDVLNHAQSILSDFQSRSVTRELWQAGDRVMNDKIIVVEKAILTLVTNESADRAHRGLEEKIHAATESQRLVMEARFKTVEEKIGDLKETRAATGGKDKATTVYVGWMVAALSIMISVVIAANAIFGNLR